LAAQRPCSYPGGCGALVEAGQMGGRCPDHQAAPAVFARGKTAARGYGAEHRRLRVDCFERDHFKCVDCGWEPESVRLYREAEMGKPPTDELLAELSQAYAAGRRHLHADHEQPIEARPDLASVLDNYRTRCNVCHNAKTAREDGGFGRSRSLHAPAKGARR
jgi:hypothetical protein